MKKLLQSVPIFAGLSPEALALLQEEGTEVEFGDGEVIFQEGEIEHCAFLIQSGLVRIVKSDGREGELELTVLNEREFFGETCLLEMIPHTATARALGPASLYCIKGATFYHLYKKMPAQYGILILNIARDLSRRLRHLDLLYCSRQ